MKDDNDVPVIEEVLPADGWADVAPACMRTADSNWLAQKMAEFQASGGTVQVIAPGVVSGSIAAECTDRLSISMGKVSQTNNLARSEAKAAKEPARLAKVLEAIESGVKGAANVAKAAKINYPILLELKHKYGFEIQPVDKPPRKERRRNEHNRESRARPENA